MKKERGEEYFCGFMKLKNCAVVTLERAETENEEEKVSKNFSYFRFET